MALLELTVTDLALIDRARVTLGGGFTVITGETGAGKSLLIDALLLVSGGRADASLVRAGATVARVEALFDRPPGAGGLAGTEDARVAHGAGAADGGAGPAPLAGDPLICVREVAAGRTVARIDDAAVPVARLAAMVEPLVAVHGQHEQQRLLSGTRQRELLDAWGGHRAIADEVATRVGAWQANRDALAALDIPVAELERRLELARHAVDEIDAVGPRPGEADEIKGRLALVAGAERFLRLADSIREALAGEGGVRDRVAGALRDARDLARTDPRLDAIAARLEGLDAEIEDVAAEVRVAAGEREADQGEASALEERLGALYGLLRKYGATEEEVLAHATAAAGEVARLEGVEEDRALRQADDARLRAEAEAAAAALTGARRTAAASAATAITSVLTELGFPGAAFAITVGPRDLDATGADEIAFVLAPNPGEPARPLARIASGGELSRVSLAIEQVLAAVDATPTLVFDEVDAGIGGRSADPVGRSLWRLGRHHQVLCVTHLPQVAAHADAHLHITKQSSDGRTVTRISELDETGRVAELAAMLSGGTSATALDAARELLDRARASRAMPATAPATPTGPIR
jgi:DNA repair protein RecN (Recombination protein N)